uniref:Uncharacterized protein n=2 Tax=Clytia hemisphaerica TaxID=252671 RepID=A0A7M5U0U2_9CNID
IDEPFKDVGDSHLIDARGWRYFKKEIVRKKQSNQVQTNFSISEEFQPKRNNLVNTIPLQTNQWALSFKFIIYDKPPASDQQSGILTFATTNADGLILQKLFEIRDSKNSMRIFIVQHNSDIKALFPIDYEFNKWYHLSLEQIYIANDNHYVLSVMFNHRQILPKNGIFIKNPKKFNNVKCFAGPQDLLALNGRVSGLEYKQTASDKSFKTKYSFLVDIIPTWPGTNWEISFKIRVHSMKRGSFEHPINDYQNVFQLGIGENHGKDGTRIASLFIQKPSRRFVFYVDRLVKAWYGISSASSSYIQAFEFDQEYNIKVNKFGVHVQIFIDSDRPKANFQFYANRDSNNVQLHFSNPWYDNADATITNLKYNY